MSNTGSSEHICIRKQTDVVVLSVSVTYFQFQCPLLSALTPWLTERVYVNYSPPIRQFETVVTE